MLFLPFAKTESLGTATLPKWLEARPASGVSVGVSGTSSLKCSARCMILFETSDIVDGKPINGCHGIMEWVRSILGGKKCMLIFFPPSKTFPNTLKQQNFNYHQESVAHCCCSNLDKSAHTLSAWESHCPRWPKSLLVDSANIWSA